ncbi:hypothetical protein WG908_03315 [Sphingobium sp. AN641]|uniref:hypothetical protein n=1 Tax=Sphingobium sp. AN641 TaxID=3133443 RepID=UPI0030BCF3EE
MQLKLRRSQREGGIVSTNVIFCLNARAELTDHERRNLSRYKLYDQVIYNSEASRRHLDKSYAASAEDTARGGLKALMHVAMAALRLNITVRGLEKGQYIECKSMDELIAAENAVIEACQSLRTYLDIAETFDGSEILVTFANGDAQIVAQSARPEPILAPPPLRSTFAPSPALPAPPTLISSDVEAEPYYDDEGDTEPRGFVGWFGNAIGTSPATARSVLIIAPIPVIFLLFMCHG